MHKYSPARWGISIDVNTMFVKDNNGSNFGILPPPDLYLYLGNVFNKHFQVDAYGGYILFADNWNGPEIGITLKYQILNKCLGSAGLSYAFIAGGQNLPGNNTPIYYKRNFSYLNIGGEYFLTDILFIEIIYYIHLNSDLIYGESRQSYANEPIERYKLSGKLKVGFSFNFSF